MSKLVPRINFQKADEDEPLAETAGKVLRPIYLCGAGRNGSTLLMNMLKQDERCVFADVFPYEVRYLSYFAKIAMMWEQAGSLRPEVPHTFIDYRTEHIYAPPWRHEMLGEFADALPTGSEIFSSLWQQFSKSVLIKYPKAVFYAEKVAPWINTFIGETVEGHSIFLFRDPRDVFISANSYMRKHNVFAFARDPGDSDSEHALKMSLAMLNTYENYRISRNNDNMSLVLYEDLIENPDLVAKNLKAATGLNVGIAGQQDHLREHQTAPSTEETLKRWQTLQLNAEARRCFEVLLQELMLDFGYQVATHKYSMPQNVEFTPACKEVWEKIKWSGGRIDTVDANGATIKLLDEDCYAVLPTKPFDAEDVAGIWICISGLYGTNCALFWRSEEEDFSEDRSIPFSRYGSRHMEIVPFHTSHHVQWRGRIHELRVDLFNGGNTAGQTGKIRWIRFIDHFDS